MHTGPGCCCCCCCWLLLLAAAAGCCCWLLLLAAAGASAAGFCWCVCCCWLLLATARCYWCTCVCCATQPLLCFPVSMVLAASPHHTDMWEDAEVALGEIGCQLLSRIASPNLFLFQIVDTHCIQLIAYCSARRV